jgi:dolichol-phosphate mannosyltransferase
MVNFALKGILYFSKKPLMIAVNTGLLCVIFSIIYFVYYLIQKFYYPENLVPGWTSIIGLVVFIGGIQLLSIGIVGTYIGNVFDEVKSRPEYIIDEIY